VNLSAYAVCGDLGVAFGVMSTLLQFARVRRDGIDGVSLATWLLFLYTAGFWIAYGLLGSHSAQVVLGSLLIWPFQISIVAKLSPFAHGATVAKTALFSTFFSFAPILLWGWQGGVFGTGIAMTLMRAPQLIELITVRHADGVSASAWYAGVACSALWLFYYGGTHLWAAFYSTLGAGLASLAVALMTTVRHVQSRRNAAELVSA